MKALLFILLTIPVLGSAQGFSFTDAANVRSRYDTTILFTGTHYGCKCFCIHEWAVERKEISSAWVQAVYHGVLGNPAMWLNEKQICTKCLRHIQIKETRYTEPKKDEYAEALKRLEAIQKN